MCLPSIESLWLKSVWTKPWCVKGMRLWQRVNYAPPHSGTATFGLVSELVFAGRTKAICRSVQSERQQDCEFRHRAPDAIRVRQTGKNVSRPGDPMPGKRIAFYFSRCLRRADNVCVDLPFLSPFGADEGQSCNAFYHVSSIIVLKKSSCAHCPVSVSV
jgi:hypothetical protein